MISTLVCVSSTHLSKPIVENLSLNSEKKGKSRSKREKNQQLETSNLYGEVFQEELDDSSKPKGSSHLPCFSKPAAAEAATQQLRSVTERN